MIYTAGAITILIGFIIPFLTKGQIPSIILFWIGFFLLLIPADPSHTRKWVPRARVGLFYNIVMALILSFYHQFLDYFSLQSGFFITELSLFILWVGDPLQALIGFLFPVPSTELPDGTIVFTHSYIRMTLISFVNILLYMLAGVVAIKWFVSKSTAFRKKTIILLLLIIIGLAVKPVYMDIRDHLEYGDIDVEKDLITGKDLDRYMYWCKFAWDGWATKEQNEFKLFIDRYGLSGVYCYKDDEIGISVSEDIKKYDNYSVNIILYKNVVTGALRMLADLQWRDDAIAWGNPKVEMDIPISEFNDIFMKWISNKNLTSLVNAAENVQWRPIKSGQSYMAKPTIKVRYEKG